jgi:hypothetical protein
MVEYIPFHSELVQSKSQNRKKSEGKKTCSIFQFINYLRFSIGESYSKEDDRDVYRAKQVVIAKLRKKLQEHHLMVSRNFPDTSTHFFSERGLSVKGGQNSSETAPPDP